MNTHSRHSIVKVIILAGLLAGTLDITAAFVQAYLKNSAATPDRVLRYVASGIFGPKANTGGNEMIAFGLLFHYLIATVFATIFVLLAQRLRFLHTHHIISGLIYGLLAWTIMNQVVVPLSEVRKPLPAFDWKKAAVAALIIMFFIGLPIAWVNRRLTRPA